VHARALVPILRSIFWRRSLFPAILVLLVSLGAAHADDDAAVGKVSDVDGTAEIVSEGTSAAAAGGTAVRMNNELRTGADGHLQVTFRDNTVLTLSEDARVVIDRYVYDPGQAMGDVLLTTTQGAFRFATNGSCVETDKDGDNVFTTFDNHNHYLKNGTGKYQGITGKIPYTVTTLHDAVDGHAASIVNHKTTWEVK
jgi:FecR protein